MLYRTLIAGMLFATLSMLATRAQPGPAATRHVTGQPRHDSQPRARASRPHRSEVVAAGTSIVNISAGMVPSDTLKMIKLSLDEHVHAVDGVLADGADDGPVVAGHLIEAAAMQLDPQHPIIDIVIDGASGERRVLVLRNAVSEGR